MNKDYPRHFAPGDIIINDVGKKLLAKWVRIDDIGRLLTRGDEFSSAGPFLVASAVPVEPWWGTQNYVSEVCFVVSPTHLGWYLISTDHDPEVKAQVFMKHDEET